jgi:hypothetical protein
MSDWTWLHRNGTRVPFEPVITFEMLGATFGVRQCPTAPHVATEQRTGMRAGEPQPDPVGGTRTYHRLACAIEDAGWEVRDCLMWVYLNWFPKGLDVAKTIDKAARHLPLRRRKSQLTRQRCRKGKTNAD